MTSSEKSPSPNVHRSIKMNVEPGNASVNITKTDGCRPTPTHHSPTILYDDGLLVKDFKSLGSTDTAITTSSSSDESYVASEPSENHNEAPRRHRFERSLTDHEYNLFLDYLESPSCSTPKKDWIPTHVIADKVQDEDYDAPLDFLESPTRGSSRTCFPSNTGTVKDIGSDIAVPCINRMHANNDDGHNNALDLSLLTVLKESQDQDKDSTAPKRIPKSQSCQDIMALGVWAALLGTKSSQIQEKRSRTVKNLWANDDDEVASLPSLIHY